MPGPIPGLTQALLEDAYWQRSYRRERYYRPDCDYEDYAPAYCVGYVGFAQYGGSFEDAERSLVANWMRIRGDSRLPIEEAMQAVRAAWGRMERAAVATDRWSELRRLARSTDPEQQVDEAPLRRELEPAMVSLAQSQQAATPGALMAQP